jgi:predicted MPP superfamily phosphohydrolase
MKLTWLTDIHLNFFDIEGRKLFYQGILHSHCDALLISGDIAEAPCLIDILNEMVAHINKPIYFVLGNHDYYRGQINEVREAIIALTLANNQLFWLPASGMQILNKNTILLGQDGWADGRLGDYQNSKVALNDSRLITDLFQAKYLGKFKLLEKMQQLADADAMQLEKELIGAVSHNPKKIIVLMHVPPFKDACTYEGKISDDNWLPFFSSKVMGEVLMRVAEKYSSIEFLVFCGHTHGKANYKPLSNLTVKAGNAEYYRPEAQELITL